MMISDNRQLLLLWQMPSLWYQVIVLRWCIIESVPNPQPQPYQITKQNLINTHLGYNRVTSAEP